MLILCIFQGLNLTFNHNSKSFPEKVKFKNNFYLYDIFLFASFKLVPISRSWHSCYTKLTFSWLPFSTMAAYCQLASFTQHFLSGQCVLFSVHLALSGRLTCSPQFTAPAQVIHTNLCLIFHEIFNVSLVTCARLLLWTSVHVFPSVSSFPQCFRSLLVILPF